MVGLLGLWTQTEKPTQMPHSGLNVGFNVLRVMISLSEIKYLAPPLAGMLEIVHTEKALSALKKQMFQSGSDSRHHLNGASR